MTDWNNSQHFQEPLERESANWKQVDQITLRNRKKKEQRQNDNGKKYLGKKNGPKVPYLVETLNHMPKKSNKLKVGLK